MRLRYEDRNEESQLQSLKTFISDIEENVHRLGENSLLAYRSQIENLLKKYDLTYVTLAGDRYDFLDAVKDFLPEIIFIIDQDLARLDPGWKHQLMSKKVIDMTGYEYAEYSKLIEH
jgi:hypothetical protein